MERLTEREPYWLGEEFWTSAKEPDDEEIDKVYEKLKQYEDLEGQGLLLRLPCNVGDPVWDIDFGRPCRYEVTGFSFGNLNEDYCEDEVTVFNPIVVYYTNSNGSMTGRFAMSEIGKTVFLTREEAALHMQGDRHD